MNRLGHGIRNARLAVPMTQETLAAAAGVAVRTVMRAEKDGRASPETLAAICSVLGVRLADMQPVLDAVSPEADDRVPSASKANPAHVELMLEQADHDTAAPSSSPGSWTDTGQACATRRLSWRAMGVAVVLGMVLALPLGEFGIGVMAASRVDDSSRFFGLIRPYSVDAMLDGFVTAATTALARAPIGGMPGTASYVFVDNQVFEPSGHGLPLRFGSRTLSYAIPAEVLMAQADAENILVFPIRLGIRSVMALGMAGSGWANTDTTSRTADARFVGMSPDALQASFNLASPTDCAHAIRAIGRRSARFVWYAFPGDGPRPIRAHWIPLAIEPDDRDTSGCTGSRRAEVIVSRAPNSEAMPAIPPIPEFGG